MKTLRQKKNLSWLSISSIATMLSKSSAADASKCDNRWKGTLCICFLCSFCQCSFCQCSFCQCSFCQKCFPTSSSGRKGFRCIHFEMTIHSLLCSFSHNLSKFFCRWKRSYFGSKRSIGIKPTTWHCSNILKHVFCRTSWQR